MSEKTKKNKKYPPSSTMKRRMPFYPTPQNEAKLDKVINGKDCSKNEVINDALTHYFMHVCQVRIGL